MVKDTPSGPVEEKITTDDIQSHFERHRFAYGFGLGFVVASAVSLVIKRPVPSTTFIVFKEGTWPPVKYGSRW